MKMLKKLSALLLAGVLMLTMSVSAFAAGIDKDGTSMDASGNLSEEDILLICILPIEDTVI